MNREVARVNWKRRAEQERMKSEVLREAAVILP
jgi:hypothetical protein